MLNMDFWAFAFCASITAAQTIMALQAHAISQE
jgi:hypothetical protein